MNISLLNFPRIIDPRGNLTFIQFPQQLPFKIERVFWTYNVPSDERRGGHACKTHEEVIIALSGSFDVVCSNINRTEERITLNRGFYGLYIPPNTWRHLENFSSNAVSLHLSSHSFDENDYIRNINHL